MDKYNIGFIKMRKGEYFASCGCGTIKLFGFLTRRELDTLKPKCEKCGNTNFAQMVNEKRVLYPYIEVIKKDRTGFKVKRTNLSVFHDDDFNVYVKPNMVQILIYDLPNKSFKLYKNGVTVKLRKHNYEEGISRFFTSINHHTFKNLVSTEETKFLYDFAWENLSNRGYYGANFKFYKGLIELFRHQYIEILANAGLPNLRRFYNSGRYGEKIANIDGKNPSEILGIPKFALKYIRENENISLYEIKQMRQALMKIDGNRFKEILEIIKDESTIRDFCNTLDTLIEIHDTYQYNNIKKLTLYLFREIRMNQGIDSPNNGASLLRDYIRMATRLQIDYEKYPKSLKKEHDIMQMNYKVQESEMKKKEFADAVMQEDYKKLVYKKKDFAIITPKEMSELIKEGDELSHCVASYVNSIVNKQCKILFLRKSEDLETPFATIEVRGNNVRQARGYANRGLKQTEKDFIKEWAEKKELQLNYY